MEVFHIFFLQTQDTPVNKKRFVRIMVRTSSFVLCAPKTPAHFLQPPRRASCGDRDLAFHSTLEVLRAQPVASGSRAPFPSKFFMSCARPRPCVFGSLAKGARWQNFSILAGAESWLRAKAVSGSKRIFLFNLTQQLAKQSEV